MPTVAEFASYLERFAPCATAAEWDNVGLLLGDPGAPVAKVLTCLTLTPDVVEEAVRGGAIRDDENKLRRLDFRGELRNPAPEPQVEAPPPAAE